MAIKSAYEERIAASKGLKWPRYGPAFLLAAASSGVSRIIKKAADQTAREDATR